LKTINGGKSKIKLHGTLDSVKKKGTGIRGGGGGEIYNTKAGCRECGNNPEKKRIGADYLFRKKKNERNVRRMLWSWE